MSVILTHELHPGQHHEQQDQIYNALDAALTVEIFEEISRQHNEIGSAQGSGLIYNFEKALQAPILDMMLRGFKIDEFERQRAISELREKMSDVYGLLQRLAGAVWDRELNPRSSDQLKAFFYGAMKLPEEWQSKKGIRKLSMDRESLEKLEDKYFYARPIIAAILSYRDLAKLCETIETQLDRDGRWRSSYNIGGTETGRLSSSKSAFGTGSNAQNLKRDDDIAEGMPSIRRMFIADDGMKICNIDLEQTESFDVGFLHGSLLGDWKYLDAAERGDLHTQVARMVWPTDLPWTGDLKADRKIAERPFYRHFTYRDMAKRGGHLSNYSGTAWTMARSLKIPLKIAEAFQDAYALGDEAAFPAFPKWWQHVAAELQTNQRLVTPYGRERHFFGRPRDDVTLREAIAFVPQSSTADRMNLGLWRIWKFMGHRVQLLAQVHDSVAFQYAENDDEAEIITQALKLTRVPLVDAASGRSMTVGAEAKVGWNWGAWDAKANPNGLRKWTALQPDMRQRNLVRIL